MAFSSTRTVISFLYSKRSPALSALIMRKTSVFSGNNSGLPRSTTKSYLLVKRGSLGDAVEIRMSWMDKIF